jgi:hypothetical protein
VVQGRCHSILKLGVNAPQVVFDVCTMVVRIWSFLDVHFRLEVGRLYTVLDGGRHSEIFHLIFLKYFKIFSGWMPYIAGNLPFS